MCWSRIASDCLDEPLTLDSLVNTLLCEYRDAGAGELPHKHYQSPSMLAKWFRDYANKLVSNVESIIYNWQHTLWQRNLLVENARSWRPDGSWKRERVDLLTSFIDHSRSFDDIAASMGTSFHPASYLTATCADVRRSE